jgi:hypothetical protein
VQMVSLNLRAAPEAGAISCDAGGNHDSEWQNNLPKVNDNTRTTARSVTQTPCFHHLTWGMNGHLQGELALASALQRHRATAAPANPSKCAGSDHPFLY